MFVHFDPDVVVTLHLRFVASSIDRLIGDPSVNPCPQRPYCTTTVATAQQPNRVRSLLFLAALAVNPVRTRHTIWLEPDREGANDEPPMNSFRPLLADFGSSHCACGQSLRGSEE